MTIKYTSGDFQHSEKFGFTGSAGKAHVKPHVRKAPVRRPKATPDLADLPMQPLIPQAPAR